VPEWDKSTAVTEWYRRKAVGKEIEEVKEVKEVKEAKEVEERRLALREKLSG
jgi:hypothetical protein